MLVFKLPAWVIHDIDRIRRDLGFSGTHLIAWNRICRPHLMGGWRILNLKEFNKALLGKWLWKLTTNPNSYWSKIVDANYSIKKPPGILFQNPPRIKSFFWAWIYTILASFRTCISKIVRNGVSTSFWFDRWYNSHSPKDPWITFFMDCNYPWLSLKQFTLLLNI